MKCRIYIVFFISVFLVMTMPISAKQPRAYLLGGGHTNMSGRQWVTDHNGLRSGTFGYVHNLFGIYADGAWSTMFNSVPNAYFHPKGTALGGGICYEHQRGIFKLQIGLGIRYQTIRNTVGDTIIIDPSVTDSRGYSYTLRYNFHDRVDDAWNLHTQLPVLLGLGVKDWYFLAGVKFNYTLSGSTSMTSLCTTTGSYKQFGGTFQEMDNHGLRKDVEIDCDGQKLDLKMDALLSLETGYEFHNDFYQRSRSTLINSNLGERLEWRFRIAAYVDYGLINICPQTSKELIYIPKDYKWDFAKFNMNHVFSSSVANACSIHNFYVGIKLTALIGSYSYKHCVLCSDFESEATMSR